MAIEPRHIHHLAGALAVNVRPAAIMAPRDAAAAGFWAVQMHGKRIADRFTFPCVRTIFGRDLGQITDEWLLVSNSSNSSSKIRHVFKRGTLDLLSACTLAGLDEQTFRR